MSNKLDNIYKASLILDPMDKRLYEKCKKVTDPNSTETLMIVQRMIQICDEVGGVGLAANQIGINRQIMVCLNEQTGKYIEFINLHYTGGTPQTDANVYWDFEGCLSHPGVVGEVARYNAIEFIAQRMGQQKPQRFTAQGRISRVIQHEYDHTVLGRLFTDLGPEVRNITFDMPGQQILMEATSKSLEEGPKDFVVD